METYKLVYSNGGMIHIKEYEDSKHGLKHFHEIFFDYEYICLKSMPSNRWLCKKDCNNTDKEMKDG